jgi:hypothetical protein
MYKYTSELRADELGTSLIYTYTQFIYSNLDVYIDIDIAIKVDKLGINICDQFICSYSDVYLYNAMSILSFIYYIRMTK